MTRRPPSSSAHPPPPHDQDSRFADDRWRAFPYGALKATYLHQAAWWHEAAKWVPAATPHQHHLAAFAVDQVLDMLAPSNTVLGNPLVVDRTLAEHGMNLVRGAFNAAEDAWRDAADLPPADVKEHVVGVNMATSPGRVVHRNRLMELIQYGPSTPTVHPEPVLLVPAWIMKYYVLDLTPEHSLVKYLVDHGHTVFAISWKNPDAGDADLGMADYLRLGIEDALRAVGVVVPERKVHAVGYCLGGTLLAIAAAALGRDGDPRLKSVTLLAAQTDFSEPGELGLFIDDAQVAMLEGLMSCHGYLDKRQMAQTFQWLRANSLVWAPRITEYLLGERTQGNALMAWNADGTRLPLRMHSEYLRGLYLANALARGQWQVGGHPVNLADVHVPLFAVATAQDHVAPWPSVFKLHALTHTDLTFVLTEGGHNVGIVNPPGNPRASYRLRRRKSRAPHADAAAWLASTPSTPGSWWEPWAEWLRRHSTQRVAPPALGAAGHGLPPLEAAPGTYVLRR